MSHAPLPSPEQIEAFRRSYMDSTRARGAEAGGLTEAQLTDGATAAHLAVDFAAAAMKCMASGDYRGFQAALQIAADNAREAHNVQFGRAPR